MNTFEKKSIVRIPEPVEFKSKPNASFRSRSDENSNESCDRCETEVAMQTVLLPRILIRVADPSLK